ASMPGAAAAGLPASWRLWGSFGAANADRAFDLTLPAANTITVRVLGDEDEPLAGAQLLVPGYSWWFPLDSFGGLTNVQLRSGPTWPSTGASGEATIVAFDGTQPIFGRAASVLAPPGSGYANDILQLGLAGVESLYVVHLTDLTSPVVAFAQTPD